MSDSETPKRMVRLVHALALCVGLLAAGEMAAAPLHVIGRSLQDAHGNNILMRGVNLPVYKSGFADDLDAVAAAIALTKTNVVRLEWWAVPPAGTTEYTVSNLNRAIQKFYDLGIIPLVELHDLTFQFGHDDKVGPNSDGNDRALFASRITAFWTRPDVLAVLVAHQDHLVINLANEWGSSLYSDATPTTANFIQNYTDAIATMRNAGIIAPLMVDAPKGFEYQFHLDHGQALLAADPQHNTMLSAHAYWAASAFTDVGMNAIVDAFALSGLPIVLGEASSQAYTNIPCDPIHYPNLLTRANTNAIGYLFWSWYEDGQCGQLMNITVGPNGDGVTLPTVANPGFGYDSLYAPGFGIDAAQPATLKADFSPAGALALLNSSFGYSVTSSDDNVTRSATALVTRLNNFGVEKRPVVVLMPGWGGVGDVAAVRDAQAVMFANQGYVALNIGFHQTNSGAWHSDLAESAKAALDALCVQTYADCSAVVLAGESYGGTQIHPVVRYLRALGVFDGSGAGNAGRKVVALLGQDSGYTYYFAAPIDADATAYSIAMIQNLGDTTFPVDSCADGNCGARNRADYHHAAAGSQYVLSYCPVGGEHGTRGYADWDAWVLSAVKTMLHNQRGVPKFTGYVEPSLAPSNACLTAAQPQLSASPTTLDFGGQSMGTTSLAVVLTVTNSGGGTVTISDVSVSSAQFAQTNNCTSVAPAASCTINVTFSPAVTGGAINSTLPVAGTLTITSNGAGSPNTVPLAGIAEKSLVTHYYRAILNRVPDATGKAFWEGEAARLAGLGADLREAYYVMAGYFFNSAEYQSYGKTDTQFITDLYNTFFNRPPDGGGLAYWLSQIQGGLPREVVLFSFMFSPEFQSFTTGLFGNVNARPEVNMVIDFFRGVLNRLPDTAAYNFWVGELKTAQCQGAGAVYQKVNEISYAFIFGPEYTNRFRNNTQYVTDEYYSFLRRGGDTAGVLFWINQLNTAAKDRNTERADFIASPEFGARVNAVIAAGCVP